MNQLQELRRMGIQVHINGSDIVLEAAKSLSDEHWEHAVSVAWENKSAIICGLEIEGLCVSVGARLEYRAGRPVLIFDPPLHAPDIDPYRWNVAAELEELFWHLVRTYSASL